MSAAVCILGWVLGWIVWGRARSADQLPAAPGARCAIVIPARDEAANIASLLSGLAEEPGGEPDRAQIRIVVVDDQSSDATRSIAGSFAGVEVIDAPALPTGWTGKCWALHCGVAAIDASAAEPADDDVLVFLDADVRIDRSAVASLIAERSRCGGLVSVQPWHHTQRPYEQLSALFNVVAMMGTAAGATSGPTGAFGPVLVTSGADYRRVGGHRAVRSEVIEDVALAQRYRSEDLPLTVLRGGTAIRFRMYPSGPFQLIEGWTKNFAAGAGATRPLRLAAIALWVTALASAAIDLVSAATPLALLIAAGLYVAFVAQLVTMFGQVGRFGRVAAVLYPVLVIFFVGIFVRSLWLTHVRRSVRWRGRCVPIVSTEP